MRARLELVGVAMVVWSLVACGGSDKGGYSVRAAAGPGAGSISLTVNGKEKPPNKGIGYTEDIAVDGEFEIEMIVTATTDQGVSCRLTPPFVSALDIEDSDYSERGRSVRCTISGTIDGDSVDFEVASEVLEPSTEDEPNVTPGGGSVPGTPECAALYQARVDSALEWADASRGGQTSDSLNDWLDGVNDELASNRDCDPADANAVLCDGLGAAFEDDTSLEILLKSVRDDICERAGS